MTRQAEGNPARRGFTLVELMFGVIFTCMVLGALTALFLAVTANWRDSQDRVFLPVAGTTAPTYSALQRFNYLDSLVKNAKCIGFADKEDHSASSAVFLWATDDAVPGKMQLSEIRLLEYDSSGHNLNMWYVPVGGHDSSDQLHYDDIKESDKVQVFKQKQDVISQVLLRNVADFVPKVVLNPVDPSQRPALEYILKITQGPTTATRYQTVTLRAPEPNP